MVGEVGPRVGRRRWTSGVGRRGYFSFVDSPKKKFAFGFYASRPWQTG